MRVPQNGWFIREDPINMDDLGVPLFQETPIWTLVKCNFETLHSSPCFTLPQWMAEGCISFFHRHRVLYVCNMALYSNAWSWSPKLCVAVSFWTGPVNTQMCVVTSPHLDAPYLPIDHPKTCRFSRLDPIAFPWYSYCIRSLTPSQYWLDITSILADQHIPCASFHGEDRPSIFWQEKWSTTGDYISPSHFMTAERLHDWMTFNIHIRHINTMNTFNIYMTVNMVNSVNSSEPELPPKFFERPSWIYIPRTQLPW